MQIRLFSILFFFICTVVNAADFSGTYKCHLTDHSFEQCIKV